MDFIFNVLSFLLVILVIVFIHEFGHFYFARIFGVQVEVFSIGFGPKLFKYLDKKQTEWRICAIPFGGYVKMYGDVDGVSDPENNKKIDNLDKKKSFFHKSLFQRSMIVFGGPLANYVLAAVLFSFVLYSNGIPKLTGKVIEVQESSSAYKEGILPGDNVLSINGKEVSNLSEEFRRAFKAEDYVVLEILRDGAVFDYSLDKEGVKGISFLPQMEKASAIESVSKGIRISYNMSLMILDGMWKMITGKLGTDDLGGPIKIAQYSSDAAKQGVISFMWFIALISINIGLLNLLPIPVLDGGRLLFYLFELILRRPIPKSVQSISFRLGFIAIISIMVLATFNDLKIFFN